MTSIKLYVNGAHARAQVFGELVAGTVGIAIDAKFNDEWNDLNKHLVCRNGKVVKTKLDFQNGFTVAPEAMIAGGNLEIGFEGMSQDGNIVFPTVWASCGVVKDGANANDDYSADPTNPVWDQLEKQIGDLSKLETSAKDSIVEAVNEVAKKDVKIPAATAETLGGVKAEPATENDTQPVRIGEDGMLYTKTGSGGAGDAWELIADITFEEQVNSFSIDVDQKGNPFSLKKYLLAYVWEKITEGEQSANYMFIVENNRQYGDNQPPLYTDAFEVARVNSLVGGMIYNELLPNHMQWGQVWRNTVQSSISVEPFRPIAGPLNNVMGKTVFRQHNDYLPFYQIGGKYAVMPKDSRVMLWGVRA